MEAKISLQRGSMLLSAEGSESFVRDSVELWDKLLGAGEAETLAPQGNEASASKSGQVTQNQTENSGLSQYDHVFDSVNERLKIIATIPGKSKAEQTRNVALLILYGQHLQGVDHVQSEQIRSACVDQGCYDGTNFAGYLRGLKSSVVMNTKPGGQYDIKLTAPGRKAARELADQLQGADQ